MAKRICVPCSIICLCQGPFHKVFRWQSFATANHSLFMALWNFINFTWKPAQTIHILRSFWIIIKYNHIQISTRHTDMTRLQCNVNKTLFYLESFNSKLSHKILTVRTLCWKIFIESRAHAAGWTDRYSVYATKTCSVSTSVWGCYYTNIQVMVWFQLTNNMNVIWCNIM